VMSATQRRFGAAAEKSRSSRSAGRGPVASGTVMRGFFRLAAELQDRAGRLHPEPVTM